MHLDLSTPALLFPAISLLLLAYTNRFMALASLVRGLHEAYRKDQAPNVLGQIANLRRRLHLIRDMQFVGVLGLAFCVLAMLLLYVGFAVPAQLLFASSLLCLLASLGLSLVEIRMSVGALELHLRDIEQARASDR